MLLTGCSLAFPLGEYDSGTSAGGAGGAGAGGAGAGGDAGGGSPPNCEGGPNPPLSEIVSDFDSGLGDNLQLLNCAAIVDGELHTDPAVHQEYCWVFTTGVRRLACDAVTVRLLQSGQQSGTHRFIYIRQNDGDGAINVLHDTVFSGDLTFTDTSFSQSQDSWWRVSADETTVTFATSSDGATWNTKGTATATFPLDNISIAVGSGMWLEAGGIQGLDRFDCFNVGPPCGD